MAQSKIWLSSPHMGGNEKKYIDDAFAGNWIAPLGPNVTGFEENLEHYLGDGQHVAALSSGTAAIHLGLIMLGVGAGDEVICQSMTFSASANPIAYLGATPVFVDSEPDTWNICPNFLEEAIIERLAKGKKPKAIIAVHLYGMPYKVDEVNAVAKKYDIPILEDAAEALGSTYNGKKCGTFGTIGILSFNGNKIITTSGGGALVTNNKAVKERAVYLATQARDDKPYYQHTEIGYNYRLSNISAGIGRGQMEVLNRNVNLRRGINNFYRDFFKEIEGVTVFTEYDERYFSNFWLTTILIDADNTGGITPNKVRLELLNDNIEARPLWKPMHLQPVFKDAPYYGANISEQLFNNGLCLPSGSNMGKIEFERISIALKRIFNNL
ncbi:aminotransferase class I/II-fold pyridoxal phosphate-dependent enzyme [Flavobacterium zepuense]|uniref:Aminotransferase class I/II-fold pyridoxal phosphate-dependent enzyme n=1 Tax=Flavobacterium zepuense TaxID=2593302 RepID=A0A552V2F6_9FLAO|nr:aminotransferase class I/II-fold pyridoxal phosphate-dependent enzyme [Flavobacterium zepuense]TRW24647.1 aminotransferase class I/II-fold pyridoxal phosphate-dependent enzyme [Flavobacterium zepuense]